MMLIRSISIFFFTLVVGMGQLLAQAPKSDSPKNKYNSSRANQSIDSIRLMQKADSLQIKFDQAQSKLNNPLDSVPLLNQGDSLERKFNSLQGKMDGSTGRLTRQINSPNDSVSKKLESIKKGLRSKLDSLNLSGAASEAKKYQQKLDSLERFPQQQYNKLMANKVFKKADKLQDSLQSIKGKANAKLAEVNKVTDKAGIGTLGKDIKTGIPSGLNTNQVTGNLGLPQGAGLNNTLAGSSTLPNVSGAGSPVGNKLPGLPAGQTGLGGLPSMPNEVKDITNGIKEAAQVTKEIGEVSNQAGKYAKEGKAIKEEGLGNTKKIPELIEKQAGQVADIKTMEREKAAMEKQLKQQKELIDKYKNEKAIKEDMEKKVKELANDKVTEFQAKVDAPMKDLKKYKKKFSDVPDMRNLPKRAPNPMKGLGWRERVVPGFMLQTISKTKTWLEITPQFYYKLNGSWSAGAGWVYRFSMDAGKLTFDDFGNLNGQIIFLQYHAFKGFFLRAEGEHMIWQTWTGTLDEGQDRNRYATSIGIGKSFNFSEKLKGNIQTLYHYTWQGPDPYPSAIEIRFGLNFSLKPKKQQNWKTKLKELEKRN